MRFGLLTCLGVYSIARVPCASPFFQKIRGRVHNLLLLPRTPRTLDSPLLGNGCVCRIGADKSRHFKTCVIAWCVPSSGSATKRRKLAKTQRFLLLSISVRFHTQCDRIDINTSQRVLQVGSICFASVPWVTPVELIAVSIFFEPSVVWFRVSFVCFPYSFSWYFVCFAFSSVTLFLCCLS